MSKVWAGQGQKGGQGSVVRPGEFSRGRRTILPLLEERVGVRTVVPSNFFVASIGLVHSGSGCGARVCNSLKMVSRMLWALRRKCEFQNRNVLIPCDCRNFSRSTSCLRWSGKTVLAAVQLHIQCRLLAKEIQIVITGGMLTAEFVTAKPPVAQPTPHEFFGPIFSLAKLAAAFDVGHNGNPGNGRGTEKFVLRSPLPVSSPPGEDMPSDDFGFIIDRPANPHCDRKVSACGKGDNVVGVLKL